MSASYTLRYMLNEDIPQVVEIDRLSFPSPWPPRSYGFEINDNNSSHMVSLVEPGESVYAPVCAAFSSASVGNRRSR